MTRQEHLLIILMEECTEVAQRISKALRFGLTEIQPDQPLTNEERIKDEYGDLIAVAAMLENEGVRITDISSRKIAEKATKVEKFLRLSAKEGRLDGGHP